jgi:hypothetical protein
VTECARKRDEVSRGRGERRGDERGRDEGARGRTTAPGRSSYDAIAGLYDAWSRSVTEDVQFYVDEARRSGGPVVELGVGTGRIAVPTAAAGVTVIGVDSSEGMLAVCREYAELAGVRDRLDLRLGDLRDPPVDEAVPLVTTCLSPEAASSSTSSRRAPRTSPTHTIAGSSASPASTSARSGTRRHAR